MTGCGRFATFQLVTQLPIQQVPEEVWATARLVFASALLAARVVQQ